jgi:hypothetical protein
MLRQLFCRLPAYHALLSQHAYHFWPDHRAAPLIPRVLFVLTKPERLANVLRHLAQQPTLLWRCPPAYKPTDEDRGRALAFLDTHFRFALLDELSTPDLITEPIWRTVKTPGTGVRLPIYRPRFPG